LSEAVMLRDFKLIIMKLAGQFVKCTPIPTELVFHL
jgi:hypothetical protein